jgi:hypothetical protein
MPLVPETFVTKDASTMAETPRPAAAAPSRLQSVLFWALAVLCCVWVLSLPNFPAQDAPAHRYYAEIASKILHGDAATMQSYSIRHPFPPYGSQVAALIGLSHWVSVDTADEIFVCLIVLATALGVRLCCTYLGPGGGWVSFGVFPLLFHWSLLMGFMNYSLGLGLMLINFGLWLRATDGRRAAWAGFVLLALLLTVTHPVALLLLLMLCGWDLGSQMLDRKLRGASLLPPRLTAQVLSLGLLCLLILYPVLITNKVKGAEAGHAAFRFRAYGSDLLLYGLAPYARHSYAPLILLYKLALYVILFGGFAVGLRGVAARWRERRLLRTDYLLPVGLLFYIGLPLISDTVNGSVFFATRMLIVPWFIALLVASRWTPLPGTTRLLPVAAFAMWLIALLPAQAFIAPAARQVAAVERLPLPARAHVLMLASPIGGPQSPGLETSPLIWAPMLAVVQHDDVMVNSPWLDLGIYPITTGTDPRMLMHIVPTVQDQHDLVKHDGDLRFLPTAVQDKALDAVDVVVVSGKSAPGEGPIPTLTPAQAAAFHCTPSYVYQVCDRTQPGQSGQ